MHMVCLVLLQTMCTVCTKLIIFILNSNMVRTRNFIITLNNPKYDIHQFMEKAKAAGASAANL